MEFKISALKIELEHGDKFVYYYLSEIISICVTYEENSAYFIDYTYSRPEFMPQKCLYFTR